LAKERTNATEATVLLAVGLLLFVDPLHGQAGPVPGAQDAVLQQQNQQILNELRAIRQLLEPLVGPKTPAPQTAKLPNPEGFTLGPPDAPLTMVEYTDLQCPYCREYALTAFEHIKKNWIDTGKLRYVARDIP
jgi:protein-disulfide isomerase